MRRELIESYYEKALDYTNETGEDSTDDSSENPYLIQ